MKAIAVTGLFLAVMLSGCVTGVDDDATDGGDAATGASLVCYEPDDVVQPPRVLSDDGRVCNLWTTVDPLERQANELSVAVNPTDPSNMVATGKDYNPVDAGDCVWDGIYVTHDGGKSWTSRSLEGSNWRLVEEGGGTPHEEFGRFWCATDPVVEFGPDGTLYWTVMPYQCDAASGSKAGRGVLPPGGLNDWAFTCVSMYVLVSSDGGDSFHTVREVAFGERLVHDRQWIGVSPLDDRVLLCWRYSGNSPTHVEPNEPETAQENDGGMVCSVSEDKGDTWSRYEVASDTYFSSPWIAYGPDGTAWLAGNAGGAVVVTSSPDGGYTWTDAVEVGTYTNPPGGGEHGRAVLAGNTFRLPSYPSINVDKSGGPYDGRVYVAWRDHTNGPDADSDVVVSYSDDGQTWSPRQNVSDANHTPRFDQFMPALSVGPDGTVDVVFYDNRNDPEKYLFDLYYTYSVDGGATWSEDLRVSDVSVDEVYSRHQNGMVFLGDYIDIDSSAGHAHPVWVDTRHEKADAFVANIARPGANR